MLARIGHSHDSALALEATYESISFILQSIPLITQEDNLVSFNTGSVSAQVSLQLKKAEQIVS